MKSERHKILVLSLMTAIAAAGCAGKKAASNSLASGSGWTTEQFIEASRGAAHSSMKAADRSDARDFATRGIEYSERCLMNSPEEVGCYYWRAVNTGLFYRIRIVGYQNGVKKMIDDCKRVIALDPRYDNAGAYRMLGQIYARLPQTGAHAESITRDLALAEKYLRKAVRLAPEYPENHLVLAEVLLAQEKFPAAIEALANSKDLAPHWTNDISYDEWGATTLKLERKIARQSNITLSK